MISVASCSLAVTKPRLLPPPLVAVAVAVSRSEGPAPATYGGARNGAAASEDGDEDDDGGGGEADVFEEEKNDHRLAKADEGGTAEAAVLIAAGPLPEAAATCSPASRRPLVVRTERLSPDPLSTATASPTPATSLRGAEGGSAVKKERVAWRKEPELPGRSANRCAADVAGAAPLPPLVVAVDADVFGGGGVMATTSSSSDTLFS